MGGHWVLLSTVRLAVSRLGAGNAHVVVLIVVSRAGQIHMHRTHRTVVRSPAADFCARFMCFACVRAEGMPTSCFLVPLGTALETRTGGNGTAVVCLLLDCCNTGTQLVFSGLETVFVGCVMCDLMPDACSVSKPSSHAFLLMSAWVLRGSLLACRWCLV